MGKEGKIWKDICSFSQRNMVLPSESMVSTILEGQERTCNCGASKET